MNPAAFTIVTTNYLPHAKTLGDSLIRSNPDFKFYIIQVGDTERSGDFTNFDRLDIIAISELDIEWLGEMENRYTKFELCNALKPFVAESLLKRFPEITTLIYLDSDMIVYEKFDEIKRLLLDRDIILTPHFLSPYQMDGRHLSESDFLNTGIYNGGFFALSGKGDTWAFLDWWKRRMRTMCFVKFEMGLFVDQGWLNFVPLYFAGVEIFRDLGYNVAYWNLHERFISRNSSGKYIVNNSFPLVFFHFSGYDPNVPSVLSKYQDRYNLNDSEILSEIFSNYRERLIANGYEKFSKVEGNLVKNNRSKPGSGFWGLNFIKKKWKSIRNRLS